MPSTRLLRARGAEGRRRSTVPALAPGCSSTPPQPAVKWSHQCSSSWTVDLHLLRKRKGRRANWRHSGNTASHPTPRVAAHLKHLPKFTQISRIEDRAKPRELHSSFHPATRGNLNQLPINHFVPQFPQGCTSNREQKHNRHMHGTRTSHSHNWDQFPPFPVPRDAPGCCVPVSWGM